MIKNHLRTCCENCNQIKAFTDTEFGASSRTIGNFSGIRFECQAMVNIGCEHMYVCKKYIENQEAE